MKLRSMSKGREDVVFRILYKLVIIRLIIYFGELGKGWQSFGGR